MMPNLSQNFRKAFFAYSKNPSSSKNKENLIQGASAIYEDAVGRCGLDPDKYIERMYEILVPAIQGIKVSPKVATALDDFIRTLSWSDLTKENQAFLALNIALNLSGPKKSCLKEALTNFLTLQDKLAREDDIITTRNFAGSFFLRNSDVTKVRGKKSIIDNLITYTSTEIFNSSTEPGVHYYPLLWNVNQKIQYSEKHINSLSEKQCGDILSGLLQELNPILNAQGADDIRDHAEYMTNSGKRSALKIHSFNDQYFFTFLAKIVKSIKETLKIKTSAEKLLESTVTNAKKLVENIDNESEKSEFNLKNR